MNPFENESRCIHIGQTYRLLDAFCKHKHEHNESLFWLPGTRWLFSIAASRKFLRACAQLNTSADSMPRPTDKTLQALWGMHGLPEDSLHGCSTNDRIDCLYLWLDILYGDGTASRLNVRSRIRDMLYAEGGLAELADTEICWGDPVTGLISQLTTELPAYDKGSS